MTYAEKLKDKRWTGGVRPRVLERDGHKCVICGSGERLTIHHGYYEPGLDPWEYPYDTLWTLCWIHHQWAQGCMAEIHSIIAQMQPELLSYTLAKRTLLGLQDGIEFYKANKAGYEY